MNKDIEVIDNIIMKLEFPVIYGVMFLTKPNYLFFLRAVKELQKLNFHNNNFPRKSIGHIL